LKDKEDDLAVQDTKETYATEMPIADIHHEEPAASIPPGEAAHIAQELWAGSAERALQLSIASLNADAQGVQHGLADESKIDLVLLTFHKHPSEFEDALANSSLAQTLLERGVDIQPSWANGAKVLVEDVTAEMMECSGRPPCELRPFHVVVALADEHHVFEALQGLPYRNRPRIKGGKRVVFRTSGAEQDTCNVESESEGGDNDVSVISGSGSTQAAVQGESSSAFAVGGMEYVRTFLHLPLPKMVTPRSNYTKSSNDRHNIPNPRLWQAK